MDHLLATTAGHNTERMRPLSTMSHSRNLMPSLIWWTSQTMLTYHMQKDTFSSVPRKKEHNGCKESRQHWTVITHQHSQQNHGPSLSYTSDKGHQKTQLNTTRNPRYSRRSRSPMSYPTTTAILILESPK